MFDTRLYFAIQVPSVLNVLLTLITELYMLHNIFPQPSADGKVQQHHDDMQFIHGYTPMTLMHLNITCNAQRIVRELTPTSIGHLMPRMPS